MDITTLGVALDTSDLAKGDAALNSAAESANKAAAALDGMSATAATTGASYKAASTVISDEAASVAEALNRQLTALTATKAQMVEYDAQMAGFTEAETAQLTAIASEIELRKQQIILGTEMAEVYAVEAVAAKGASMATSGVTSELMVLGREAANGNYTKLAGSFTRFLSLAGALQLLLNPISIAIIAVGASMYEVSSQNEKMNDALVLTGGYAGVTAGQLREMTTAATAGGASFNAAAQAVTELAATGRLTGDEITNLGKTAADMATYTSVSVKQMVDDFTKLAEDPLKASIALNNQYHYLTVATYDQVAALEKQGDATGAAQVAVEAFSTAMDARTQDIAKNQGVILQGWRDIKNIVNAVMEGIGSIGATNTSAQTVAKLQAQKAAALNPQDGMANLGGELLPQWSAKDEANLQTALSNVAAEKKAAKDKSDKDQAEQDLINAKNSYATWNTQFATPAEKRAAEIQKYLATATTLGLSPEQQVSDEQKINDKYKDKKTPKARSTGAVDMTDLSSDVQTVKDQLAEELAAVSSAQKQLDALYKSGGVDQQTYYQQSRDLLAQKSTDEIDAYNKEIALLKAALDNKNLNAQQRAQINKQIQQDQNLAGKATEAFFQGIAVSAATSDAALAKSTAAVKAYTDSLNAQLATQQSAANTKLAGLSMGGNEQADYNTQIKLLEDYNKKVAALNKSWTEHPDQAGDYNAELAALQDYYTKSVAIAQKSSSDIKAANADWTTGAMRAIANYNDEAANVANSTAKVFTDAFSGMEDAFATFVTTGKLNFTSLANSIISDLARMEAKAAISGVLGMITGAMGGSLGNGAATVAANAQGGNTLDNLIGDTGGWGTVSGTRANGGTVDAGDSYMVGENGPERFTPTASGSIAPSGASGSSGGGGDVNVQIVNNSSAQVNQPQVSTDSSGQKFIRLIIDQAKSEMAGDIASGQGSASKALSQRFGLTPRFR